MLLRVHVAAPRLGHVEPLQRLLASEDAEVALLPRGKDLMVWLEGSACDVLVVDQELLGADATVGLQALARLPDVPDVVVLHGPGVTPEERARLTAAGAAATIQRDVDAAPLSEALVQLMARRRGVSLTALQADEAAPGGRLDDFASESPAMKQLLQVARRVARTDATVLVAGETGVGKEYLVRALHEEGPRARSPFVAVNCAALSESLLESELFGHVRGAFTGADRDRRGYFELAHRGTIFLDEVGEMPPHLQVKLLRVLQEREVLPVGAEKALSVDVRVIAATNRDLAAEVEVGRFRADLYYRLRVVTLDVPPLRDRREDLPRLARSHIHHFAARLGRAVSGIEEVALEALLAYRWPGNVRELINVIERAVILTEHSYVTLADLPADLTGARGATAPPPSTGLLERPWREAREAVLEDFDRRYFGFVLAAARGRIAEAARAADLSPRTLYDQLQRLGLRKEDFKGGR